MEQQTYTEAAMEYGLRQNKKIGSGALWLDYLDRDRNGAVANSLRNLSTILIMDEDLQGIRFNELSRSVELRGKLPWRPESRGGPVWRDADDANLIRFVETHYANFSLSFYPHALNLAAEERAFHPVRDWILSLQGWDGKARVDTLLVDYLGAEDTPYVRAVTRKTLVAALWRVFKPGIKFDNILVLSGPQGIGKSTLVARLGRDWFSDSLTISDMNDKTAAEKLQGYWLLEIGEMAGMKKAELEKVKSFLSRVDDKFREPYGRRVSSHPRQCVFFGTTNSQDGYLRDVTGNRRFWNVPVTGRGKYKPWDLDEETVKQIWMEAASFADTETLYLPPELVPAAEEVQRGALELDDREGLAREYLDTPLPKDWAVRSLADRLAWFQMPTSARRGVEVAGPRDKVCCMEIWCECFGKPRQELTRRDSSDIVAIMARIPGWERLDKSVRLSIYGIQRIYRRIPPAETKEQEHVYAEPEPDQDMLPL